MRRSRTRYGLLLTLLAVLALAAQLAVWARDAPDTSEVGEAPPGAKALLYDTAFADADLRQIPDVLSKGKLWSRADGGTRRIYVLQADLWRARRALVSYNLPSEATPLPARTLSDSASDLSKGNYYKALEDNVVRALDGVHGVKSSHFHVTYQWPQQCYIPRGSTPSSQSGPYPARAQLAIAREHPEQPFPLDTARGMLKLVAFSSPDLPKTRVWLTDQTVRGQYELIHNPDRKSL